MEEIEYSVIIRTTGKANEKYQALLKSIDRLEPKPQEVIVVLPQGNELPLQQLGYETFYFSKKGMVIQRLEGIKKCHTKYALICDDDVSFQPDFVEKLYQPIRCGYGYFSAGPLYSFLPPKGLNALLCAVMGSAVPTICHRTKRYVTILKTSGYSYNRHLKINEKKYYESQSVAWTCFFADIQAFKKIELDKEVWLDAHNYSALDDQTMFYKAWLLGYKTIVVPEATYEHLDARTSTRNNKPAMLYSLTYNRVVFWHRFIYLLQEKPILKFMSKLSFKYSMMCQMILNLTSILRGKMSIEDYKILRAGYKDGYKYLESKEYRELPNLK